MNKENESFPTGVLKDEACETEGNSINIIHV